MYRKATRDERENYGGLYPLHAVVVRPKSFDTICIEDLRGTSNNGDPTWEVLAPDGFHFADGYELYHSILCYSLKEARDLATNEPIKPCTAECGG